MVRILYPMEALWWTWRNQWARAPDLAMPTEEDLAWGREAPDELEDIDLRDAK